MTLIFTIIAISIHLIFLFKREILFERKSFIFLFVISIFIGLISLLVKNAGVQIRNIEMLQIPFLTLLIFFFMSKIYVALNGKNPKDSFWSNDIKLMKDGIFNFLFWVFGLIIPVFIVFK